MKFVIFFVALLASCSLSSALECYDCVSSERKCDNVGFYTKTTRCKAFSYGDAFLKVEAVCFKLVLSVGGVNQTKRACNRWSKTLDPCIMFKYPNLQHCSVCNEDLCNSAAGINHNVWVLLTFFIIKSLF